MRPYKLDKPLVETEPLLRNKNAYYVDVDEATGKLANIMEFKGNNWQVKMFADDIAIYNRSSSRLNIPSKVGLNPDGIVNAWLSGSKYESDVKEAATNANLSGVITALDTLFTRVYNSINVMTTQAGKARDAGLDDISQALDAEQKLLAEAYAPFESSNTIEKLTALAEVINPNPNI